MHHKNAFIFVLALISHLFFIPQSFFSSVFSVVGTVKNADGTLASSGLEVEVKNETKNIVSKDILGKQEAGKYSVVFLDTGNKTVANEGDVIKVTIKNAGKVIASATYRLNSDDIAKYMAVINIGIDEHPWDVNSDGIVDILDLTIVVKHFGESPPIDPRADINRDGKVNILDLVLIGRHFGEKYR